MGVFKRFIKLENGIPGTDQEFSSIFGHLKSNTNDVSFLV